MGVLVAGVLFSSGVGALARSTPVGACGLAHAAFCDTLSHATFNPAGDREGALNARFWGVSRELGYNNIGQGQYAAAVRSLQVTGSCPARSVTIAWTDSPQRASGMPKTAASATAGCSIRALSTSTE